jgi:hypothetical protein
MEAQAQTLWLDRAVENEWRREDLHAQLNPNGLPPVVAVLGDLDEVARDLVRAAKKYGADYLVPSHCFVALCVALGEEV